MKTAVSNMAWSELNLHVVTWNKCPLSDFYSPTNGFLKLARLYIHAFKTQCNIDWLICVYMPYRHCYSNIAAVTIVKKWSVMKMRPSRDYSSSKCRGTIFCVPRVIHVSIIARRWLSMHGLIFCMFSDELKKWWFLKR